MRRPFGIFSLVLVQVASSQTHNERHWDTNRTENNKTARKKGKVPPPQKKCARVNSFLSFISPNGNLLIEATFCGNKNNPKKKQKKSSSHRKQKLKLSIDEGLPCHGPQYATDRLKTKGEKFNSIELNMKLCWRNIFHKFLLFSDWKCNVNRFACVRVT